MFLRALLVVFLLWGCSDPFEDAHKADTIEAYEKYLAENPDSEHKAEATQRLNALSFKKAEAANTLEAWDAYVAKFPTGKFYKKAMLARLPLAKAQAEAVNTEEAWTRIATDYARISRPTSLQAKRRAAIAPFLDKISIGEGSVVQVNLAGDAKAAPDGWRFSAPVTNKGTEAISELLIAVELFDASDANIGHREWPVVAPKMPKGLPMKPGWDAPMAPGETRTWEFPTKDIPASWTQKFKLRPSRVRWVGATPEPEEAEAAPPEGTPAAP